MKKIIILLFALTLSTLALAVQDYSALGKRLYPGSTEDQAFVSKFFEIVELHKTHDPLFEGRGPSIYEYSLDKMKFAFMVNEGVETIDLVFFNWNLSTSPGLEFDSELSKNYGSPVYILKGVSKKAVASQGLNHNQLTNFSYLHGARYMETQLKLENPNADIEAIINWKPHPEYMDRSHPLRQTLDKGVLILLSPVKELFLQQAGATEDTRPYFEKMFKQKGGFFNVIMGMMVHEMFHAKEGEDGVYQLAKKRKIYEDRKKIIEELKTDSYLRSLFATYAKIVFDIADSLKESSLSVEESSKLSDLKTVIAEIKSKYPDAWKFIWNYEYTEGFAEYVSAYSMIQVGITTFDQQIELQKGDENNFAYRTGAIGGLYMAYRFKSMPFNNNEDHSFSVWEIILNQSEVAGSTLTTQGIVDKYQAYPFNSDEEVDRVIEYLISTVVEI